MKFTSSIYRFNRLYQLDEFPEPEHDFWFLYWIGGIGYEDGRYLSDFYFINKATLDDNFKGQINGQRVLIRLDVIYYTYLNIGCIFSLRGHLLVRAPYNDKGYKNTIALSVLNFSIPSKYPLELENILNFPIPNTINNCTYYIVEHTIDGNSIKVLIPEFVLCSYLFFRNSFVTKSLLSNTLNDCFDISILEKVALKSGMSARKILYDNRSILPQEAYSIAQFFNIKNGIISLNSINANLMKGMSSTVENFSEPYISADLQFMKEIEMEATGKFFVNDKGKKIFMIFEISFLYFKCQRETDDENILLEPMFKDEYNYQKIVYARHYQNLRANNYQNKTFSWNDRYSPHRPALYSGINVFVNHYNALKNDYNVELDSFYSYNVKNKYRNGMRSMLSKQMLKGFLSRGLKALILTYNSVDGILTRLNVANSDYFIIIYELEFSKKNLYYVELNDEALLTIHNCFKIKILLIDIVLILESIIFNYGLEANKFKPFTSYDKERYRSKLNVYINFHDNLQKSRKYLTKKSVQSYVTEIENIIYKLEAI